MMYWDLLGWITPLWRAFLANSRAFAFILPVVCMYIFVLFCNHFCFGGLYQMPSRLWDTTNGAQRPITDASANLLSLLTVSDERQQHYWSYLWLKIRTKKGRGGFPQLRQASEFEHLSEPSNVLIIHLSSSFCVGVPESPFRFLILENWSPLYCISDSCPGRGRHLIPRWRTITEELGLSTLNNTTSPSSCNSGPSRWGDACLVDMDLHHWNPQRGNWGPT